MPTLNIKLAEKAKVGDFFPCLSSEWTSQKIQHKFAYPKWFGGIQGIWRDGGKGNQRIDRESNSSWGPNLEKFQLSTAQLNGMVIG